MRDFKGGDYPSIPFDATQEIRQLRFNAQINKRRLKEAYKDLTPNGITKCPYCNEVFTGYWTKHRCDVHVRFDHEKENTEHTMAILSTFATLTNTALESFLSSSPEIHYFTSLAGDEILERPRWFNKVFLKHYETLKFVRDNEDLTLTKLYQLIPDQKERDNVLSNIFDLQMRHLVHPQERDREKDTYRPLLAEVDNE